ncbi:MULTISPECIES: hypothetical protein, partial [Paenibacillus]|uniref:hypothetical protein n=1 Tax=Paenibacillus TaxID=44249 RepID=UPI00138B0714
TVTLFTTGAAVTVIVALPDLLLSTVEVAVTVYWPGVVLEATLTNPFPSTVTLPLESLLLHVTVWAAPPLTSTVAV